MPPAPVVAVVGGGIAGLAAAFDLSRHGVQVVVLESSEQVGGKLRGSEVAGVLVDEGADSMLARVPDAVDFVREVGLGEELVTPRTTEAGLVVRGRVRPLPPGTVMGVPADLAALARSEVLSTRGLYRTLLDLALPGEPLRDDVTVGALVSRRLGREVVDRLVDPLLGGVYAGRADLLSLRMTLPQLAQPLAAERSLVRAARQVRPRASAAAPVFAGLAGGLGRLPPAVIAATTADVRTRSTVRGLRRATDGWELEVGPAVAPQVVRADAVVLAVPAAPAARLLREVAPVAAAEVGVLDYASVAVVTLVLDGATPGIGSGFLVPSVEPRATKAVTYTSRKWGHVTTRPAVVRASIGRYGEQLQLQRSDDELVGLVLRDVAELVGPLPPVVGTRVARWGGGLPQYGVGHLERVRRARDDVSRHPTLALAGAAYDGVGIPACIASGRRAARHVLAGLAQNGQHVRQ